MSQHAERPIFCVIFQAAQRTRTEPWKWETRSSRWTAWTWRAWRGSRPGTSWRSSTTGTRLSPCARSCSNSNNNSSRWWRWWWPAATATAAVCRWSRRSWSPMQQQPAVEQRRPTKLDSSFDGIGRSKAQLVSGLSEVPLMYHAQGLSGKSFWGRCTESCAARRKDSRKNLLKTLW